jgi:hypothetical protein
LYLVLDMSYQQQQGRPGGQPRHNNTGNNNATPGKLSQIKQTVGNTINPDTLSLGAGFSIDSRKAKKLVIYFNIILIILINLRYLYKITVEISPNCDCEKKWKRYLFIAAIVLNILIITLAIIGVSLPINIMVFYFIVVILYIISGYIYIQSLYTTEDCSCVVNIDPRDISDFLKMKVLTIIFSFILLGAVSTREIL